MGTPWRPIRSLLQAILQKGITLIDYECLEHDDGQRIIGFGFFAGVVGAHNGMMAYGNRHRSGPILPLVGLPNIVAVRGFGKLDAERIFRVDHEAIDAGVAHGRVRIPHDAETRGDVTAGIFLMVSQNRKLCYVHVLSRKDHLLDGSLFNDDRRLRAILAGGVLSDEVLNRPVLESDGPEQAPGVRVDIGHDR